MTKREFFQKLLANQVMPLATVEIMQHKNGTHCIYMRQHNAPNCGISTHRDGSAAAEKAFNRIHAWAHEYAVVFDDLIAEAHEEALEMQARMDREAFNALIESQRAAGHPVDEEGNDTREWCGNDIEAAHQQALNIEAERAAGKPASNKENKSMISNKNTNEISIDELLYVNFDVPDFPIPKNEFEMLIEYGGRVGSLCIQKRGWDKVTPNSGMLKRGVRHYTINLFHNNAMKKQIDEVLKYAVYTMSMIYDSSKKTISSAAVGTAMCINESGAIDAMFIFLDARKTPDITAILDGLNTGRKRRDIETVRIMKVGERIVFTESPLCINSTVIEKKDGWMECSLLNLKL